MAEKDGRRSRYVPVDVLVAFTPFGTRLHEKWGMEGLCTWMLFLAAAKREPAQGTFTYTSEAEAWTKLGATATKFGFDEFVTFCGRGKQTKKTRSGRVTYVQITGWRRWNETWKTQQDTERKSSKSRDSNATTPLPPRDTDATEYEGEYEYESEGEASALRAPPEPESEADPELVQDEPGGELVPLAAQNTQTLLAEFVQQARRVDVEIPGRVKGHLASEIKRLLDEGQAPAAVWAGLARMVERRVVQPSLLPNFVVEARLPSRSSSGQRYGRGVTTEQILEMARVAREREAS